MIGEKLIAARTEKDITQEQLAEKLYVTRQAVSRWENDKTQPDLQTLGRICSVLGVAPDYFIEVDKNETPYTSLSRERKKMLYYEFVSAHKTITVLFCLWYFFFSLSTCGIACVSTLSILDNIQGMFGVSLEIWLGIDIGIVLLAVANLFIAFYLSNVRSIYFNNWLAKRGVIRTKKFL